MKYINFADYSIQKDIPSLIDLFKEVQLNCHYQSLSRHKQYDSLPQVLKEIM